MWLAGFRAGQLTFDDLSQCKRRVDPRLSPRRHDGLGDPPRGAFFAIDKEDIRQLRLCCIVDDVSGGRARLAHPHIQWAVLLKRKPPARLINLHGRDADIEHDARQRRLNQFLKIAKPTFDDIQSSAERIGPCQAARNRLWIAINRDNAVRAMVQNSVCVTAGTKGRIQIDAATRR